MGNDLPYDICKKSFEELLNNQVSEIYKKTNISIGSNEEDTKTLYVIITEELHSILDVLDALTLPTILSHGGIEELSKGLKEFSNDRINYVTLFHSLLLEYKLILDLHGIKETSIISIVNSFKPFNTNTIFEESDLASYTVDIKLHETDSNKNSTMVIAGLIVLFKLYSRYGKTILTNLTQGA